MNEINIDLKNVGEKLLFGKNVIELKDHTQTTFVTNNIDSFLNYSALETSKTIYASETGLSLYFKDSNIPAYDLIPSAVCNINYHKVCKFIKSSNQKMMNLKEFTLFIKQMRKHLTTSALPIYDLINNIKVSKVIDIESKQDNKGNYSFSVKSESGRDDFDLPSEVEFEFPLLEHNDVTIKMKFDLIFSWTLDGTNAQLTFQLSNFSLDDEIENSLKGHLFYVLDEISAEWYWGNLNKTARTDDWRYKESNIQL